MNADALLDALIDSIVSGEAIAPERFGQVTSSEHARRVAGDLRVIAAIAEAGRDSALPTLAGPRSRIGRFELGSPLGAGGMGTVWEAHDTTLERAVAIKFLHPHLSGDPRYRERFLREGRAAARLRHRGICAIYEVGELPAALSLTNRGQRFELSAGTPYAAIELVRGVTLQGHLRRAGRLPQREVLRIATDAADALAAAHEVGIVHRDIKPANIMLGSDGRVVLLDFGLAGIDPPQDESALSAEAGAQADARLTMAGDIVGTVAYMSPEQARGDKIDARTDVFSFGLVLWEMLTGSAVDAGPSVGRKSAITLRATRTDFLPDQPPVPVAWRRVLQRCVAADASDRYPSAKELLADLHSRTRSTRRALLWPAAGGLAVAAITASVWFVGNRDRPALKSEPLQKQLTSNPPETAVHTAAVSPDGKYLVFADPTGTYLRVIQTGETRRIVTPEVLDVTGIGWFPDGTRLAITAISPNQQGVSAWTMTVLGGTPRKVRDLAIAGPLSPDGSRLLFLNLEMQAQTWIGGGVWVMGPEGEDARQVLPKIQGDDYQAFAWSPDGKRILFIRVNDSTGTNLAELAVSDFSGGSPKVLLSDPQLWFASCSSNVAWLPDGRILFTRAEPPPNQTSSNFWELRIDPKTLEIIESPKRLTNWADSCVTDMDAPPDGSHVAFLRQHRQSDVYLGELRDNGDRLDNVRRLTLDNRDDFASSWTSDSRAIYVSSNRQGTFDIFKQGVDGSVEAVVQGPGDERKARLSQDGAFLFYVAHPQGGESGPVSLMRVPVAGGAPETMLTQKEIAGFVCPRVSNAPCVLKEYHDGRLTFFAFDPVKGKGREIGSMATGLPVWSLSPDGSRIVLIGDETSGGPERNGILSMNVSDGRIANLHVAGKMFVVDLAWASDGKSLFITDFLTDATSPGWRVSHADFNGHARVLWQTRIVWGQVSNPVPSPDGRYLAFEQVGFESNAWALENF